MPRRGAQAPRSLFARQKEAAEQLRREVLGADGSLGLAYSRGLERQVRTRSTAIPVSEVLRECAETGLVYVGDFHALPSCQVFAAEVLRRVAESAPAALGVEFLYTRQQHLLDRRQRGLLDDAEFLRRVHYREEWGYPWDGLRTLLDQARASSVPVFALDVPPRRGFEHLARRDEHAARRIAAIIAREPLRRVVVLFGESHLSRGHIPRSVRRRLEGLGISRTEVTVFQDPDPAYWNLVRRGGPPPPAARLDHDTLAVFHTTPLAKYEAYRQVLERWREDVPPDEEVDLTPAVHHLIGVLLAWLGIDPRRYRLRHRAGWEEELADAFPEVYSGPEARDLLRPILEEHGRGKDGVRHARALLEDRGALYDARSNTFFLSRYLPGRAAAEGARFLRASLAGRLFARTDEREDEPVAATYAAGYEEALAYLGARLVDPASDFLGAAELRELAALRGSASAPSATARARARWLEAHRRFEASGRLDPTPEIVEPLRRSRALRRSLARDLGHRLGQTLFERVRSGRIRQRALRFLFMRPVPPSRAARIVLELLRSSRGERR